MLIQLAELNMSQDINDRPILIWENSTVKRDLPARWSLIGILQVIGWECRSFMRESAWTWEINFQTGEYEWGVSGTANKNGVLEGGHVTPTILTNDS